MLAMKPMHHLARTLLGALALGTVIGTANAAQLTERQASEQLGGLIYTYRHHGTPAALADVKRLLDEGAPVSVGVLDDAIYAKKPELLKTVLDHLTEDQVNMRATPAMNTPLITAVRSAAVPASEADLAQIKLLIEAGADLNATSQYESTSPLFEAVNAGYEQPNFEVAKMLLEAGADPRATFQHNANLLMGKAAGDLRTLRLLIDAGADPHHLNDIGVKPLSFVCHRSYEMKGQPDPQAAQRIALLVEKQTINVFPERRTQGGGLPKLPLAEAITQANPDCARAMIAAGADPDAEYYPADYTQRFPQRQISIRNYVKKDALRGARRFYPPPITEIFN